MLWLWRLEIGVTSTTALKLVVVVLGAFVATPFEAVLNGAAKSIMWAV